MHNAAGDFGLWILYLFWKVELDDSDLLASRYRHFISMERVVNMLKIEGWMIEFELWPVTLLTELSWLIHFCC